MKQIEQLSTIREHENITLKLIASINTIIFLLNTHSTASIDSIEMNDSDTYF